MFTPFPAFVVRALVPSPSLTPAPPWILSPWTAWSFLGLSLNLFLHTLSDHLHDFRRLYQPFAGQDDELCALPSPPCSFCVTLSTVTCIVAIALLSAFDWLSWLQEVEQTQLEPHLQP